MALANGIRQRWLLSHLAVTVIPSLLHCAGHVRRRRSGCSRPGATTVLDQLGTMAFFTGGSLGEERDEVFKTLAFRKPHIRPKTDSADWISTCLTYAVNTKPKMVWASPCNRRASMSLSVTYSCGQKAHWRWHRANMPFRDAPHKTPPDRSNVRCPRSYARLSSLQSAFLLVLHQQLVVR